MRCAIYTRKSTEEGLEQTFNSLDAQREACEAYVLSQAGEGWECLPELYDDGGWSGGNMDRPALLRLLADIGKGRIDVVVVYKVDRLTRSLMDFARIVEVFDQNKVSFVSVTQAFNTTSSMGRLTLNVLLSFAQFEREVTGERIRDKIAQSKARGIWMGGHVPLGYDLGERVLLPHPTEAETVRHIFRRYLELKSLPALVKDLTAAGILTKRRTSRAGNTQGGIPFNCSGLSHILRNRIYLGEIVHRGKAHAGEHEAIVDKALFKAVQDQLATNHHRHHTRKTRAGSCPLTGRIVDGEGQPMRPSFSYGRGSRTYRYYVSECLLPTAKATSGGNLQGIRLPAVRIETLLFRAIGELLPEPTGPDMIFAAITRIEATPTALRVTLDPARLVSESLSADALLDRVRRQIDPDAALSDGRMTFTLAIPAGRKGRTVAPSVRKHRNSEDTADMAELVRVAHRKLAEHDASPLDPGQHARMRAPVDAWTRERIAIGLLAPDIQKALLQGTMPRGFDPDELVGMNLPLDWGEQRRMLGMAG
nr:recombinase family protein [Novosphingobium flavum]